MKKIIVLLAMALVATASFGWVSISWNADEGFLSAWDGDTIQRALADSATKQLVWDLVYTTGSSAATLKYDATKKDVDYGSDVVLSRRVWEGGDTVSVKDNPFGVEDLQSDKKSASPIGIEPAGFIGGTDGVYNNGLLSPTGKSFYSVVFQTLDSGDVWYAMSDLVTIEEWNGSGMTPTPKDVNFGVDYEDDASEIYGKKIGTQLYKNEVVPEPATMSLLGLGALAMVIRRKLRK